MHVSPYFGFVFGRSNIEYMNAAFLQEIEGSQPKPVCMAALNPRGIRSARECYCAVRVTVRRRWYDIVMLSSCALSEGVPGVRFFTPNDTVQEMHASCQ